MPVSQVIPVVEERIMTVSGPGTQIEFDSQLGVLTNIQLTNGKLLGAQIRDDVLPLTPARAVFSRRERAQLNHSIIHFLTSPNTPASSKNTFVLSALTLARHLHDFLP